MTPPPPLTCTKVIGAPGGAGLDSLARLLLQMAADAQPAPAPDPPRRRVLSAVFKRPLRPIDRRPAASAP